MDAFTDSELFDDDAPCALPPQTEETTDPLTVSADSPSPRPRGEGTPRRAAYVVAALAVLVVAALALHAGSPSPERYLPHETARGHHVRQHPPHPRERTVMHRRAAVGRSSVPVSAAKVVVTLPSSSHDRPIRTESVGTGRPTSTGQVGNTEQFGYLGR
jgi:hypothetical protein